jgi:hypothetical protein
MGTGNLFENVGKDKGYKGVRSLYVVKKGG